MTMPAVSAIRRRQPEARILWLIEDRAASILDAYPDVDGAIVYERRALSKAINRFAFKEARQNLGACFQTIRDFRPDIALDFQSNLKSAWLLKLANVENRVGFDWRDAKELAWLFHTKHVKAPRDGHRLDRSLALANCVGVEKLAEPPFLSAPTDVAHIVSLEMRRLFGGRPFCAIHPGSSEFGAFKRWPAQNYAVLAQKLYEQCDIKTLVLWGPSEQRLAEDIVAHAGEAAVLSPGWPSLSCLVAVAELATIYVGADTGPTYIFWGADCPVVALFGPKSEAVYAPRGRKVQIVTADVACRPCGKRSCANPICMQEIQVQKVFNACQKLLEKKP